MTDFSTNYTVRTDMADELTQKIKAEKGNLHDGITFCTKSYCGKKAELVSINTENAAKKYGKKRGQYLSFETGEMWNCERACFESFAKAIGTATRELLPNDGLCLIACLGNRSISPDALGPVCARSLVVSKHIKENNRLLFDSFGLRECACVVPDVLGNTGLEAAEIIKGVCDRIKPCAVIVIDALASSRLSRLTKTVQLSDAGISPGSGVNNSRQEISRDTLGVPVISLGVPTVVDCVTLTKGVLESLCKQGQLNQSLLEGLLVSQGNFFVTPKDSDRIIGCMAKLLGYSVNYALHKSLDFSDMDELLS